MRALKILATGGALVVLGMALDGLCCRRERRHVEKILDDALDDTYPASDPTATQDFSSPDERAAMRATRH